MSWTRVCGATLFVLVASAGCGDSGADSADGSAGFAGASSGAGGAAAGAGGGAGPAAADCATPPPLFSPRPLGEDGVDVIGEVAFDESSGDVYFATSNDFFVLPEGSGNPRRVAARPTDVWAGFWLRDDRALFPSGFQVPLVDTEIAVLFSMPLAGGEAEVQVGVPVSDEFGWSYEIGSVEVVGDDVYWVGRDRFNDTTMPLGGETTYYVRRTSWRSPGEPEDLYSGSHSLSEIIVGGGHLFFTEQMDLDDGEIENAQRIIDLSTGTLLEMSSEELHGGVVIAADEDSMLVTRTDTVDFEQFGTWYVAADGSDEVKLGDVLILLFLGPPTAVSRDGRWAFTSLGFGSATDMHVYTFSPAEGLRDLGCYDANDSTFGIEIAGDRVIVPTFRDNESTLIAFDL